MRVIIYFFLKKTIEIYLKITLVDIFQNQFLS